MVLEDPAAAASLLHPMRRRILEHLTTADSASGVARHLRLSRQKVNYHLRDLEKHGLVSLVREQQRGNCTERIVVAAAQAFALSPKLLGRLAVDRRVQEDDEDIARWGAALSRALRDLAGAGAATTPTFLDQEIRLPNESAREEFLRGVTELARHLERKYAAADGESHQILAGVYRRASFDLRFGA